MAPHSSTLALSSIFSQLSQAKLPEHEETVLCVMPLFCPLPFPASPGGLVHSSLPLNWSHRSPAAARADSVH